MTGAADPRSDAELVSSAIEGAEDAFGALYDRYFGAVYDFVYRVTRSADDASDVVQDVFRYFFSKFPGFTLICRLKTFLYPVVKNRAIDLIRKQKRLVALEDQPEELSAPEQRSEEGERRQVMEHLADLSENHREILIARFVDGMNLPELADQLAVPQGTVKSRLHHALNQLRKKMKKE